MSSDNIISFPSGSDDQPAPKPQHAPDAAERISEPGTGALGIPGLTTDQEKAIQLIMGGMPFVFVGIKPTGTGADFFTAIDGPAEDLRNAHGHLDGVISRLYDRRGL